MKPDNKPGLITSAQFLQRELPIRLAHRIVELDNLPHGLNQMPSVRRVSEWYRQSFDEITRHDLPRTAEQEASFARLLATIYDRHSPTLVTMARGIMEFRQSHGLVDRKQRLPAVVEDDIFGFLDVFFMSRVGIRTLIAQHLALHEPRPNHVGIINTACRPSDVIHTAAMDAKAVCERSFGEAPDVKVLGDVKFQFAHIPMFIHHIIFELLKNSMRATVETHSEEHGRSKGLGVESAGAAGASPPSSSVVGEPRHGMPPVKIILSASEDTEDVVIKISDEGGGIPRSGIQRIFSYFYTTAPAAFMDGSHDAAADFSSDMPMAGLGFGLPLSRVYAR